MQAPPAPQANVPVVAVGPPLGAPTAPTTYHEKYQDPSTDIFAGNYINLYNEFSVGNTQPAALRNAIYRDGNGGTYLHGLVHVKDALAGPGDPGTIVAVHRLTRHEPRFALLPLPYDNIGFAFFGDVVNGQAPTTVMVPDIWFNQTTQVQAPTHGLLAQELAADPAQEVFGPYAAGQADVTPVVSRRMVLVPNRYALPFLTVGLKPREAYAVLLGMVQQDGQEVACEPLLDWLRLTLTLPGGNALAMPVTCTLPASAPSFANPQVQQTFSLYRQSIFHADFPHLLPGHPHQSAALIAQGLTSITDEQRLARQEAQQRQAAKTAQKLPRDAFGVLLDRLMRWCQVDNEADLPPIYAELANTKKGKIRIVIQTAVEDALANLKYIEDFPVSSSLATKIQELKWHSQLTENLSIGVNIFCLGSLDEEAIERQRQLNQHADALFGGEAAPSLIDLVAVQDTKLEVCIPKTIAQLRYLVERTAALWLVFLGSHHPVTQTLHHYRQSLVTNEKRLERVSTRDPHMRNLVPALLARVIQLEINAWFLSQMRSAAPITIPPLTDVFRDIDRERQWEPSFPSNYLTGQRPPSGQLTHVSPIGAATAMTAASSVTGMSTALPATVASSVTHDAPSPSESVIVRNALYKDDVFGTFKALGHKARTIKESIRRRHVSYPNNSQGHPMCLTYHVIGVCNSRCKFATDHCAHTAAEDETFRAWCAEHYKLE
jgi:hypothetical protein